MPINGYFTPFELNQIHTAIDYIEKHYQESISTNELAIEIGMDIKSLQIGIQLFTGHTVHNYLLKVRVNHAAEDLKDFDYPIKFIARKHGFSSASHLGVEFKKQMGMTPKRYRFDCMIRNNDSILILESREKLNL